MIRAIVSKLYTFHGNVTPMLRNRTSAKIFVRGFSLTASMSRRFSINNINVGRLLFTRTMIPISIEHQ